MSINKKQYTEKDMLSFAAEFGLVSIDNEDLNQSFHDWKNPYTIEEV